MTENTRLIELGFKEINRLTDNGQLMKALKLCEEIFEQNPVHPRVLHALGMLRYRTGGVRLEAEQLVRKAIQLKPDFADAYYNLGIMLHNAVLEDEAEEQFRTVLKYDPAHFKAMTTLATLLIERVQLQEAQNLCDKALALCPHYAPIYQNFGKIMQAFGRVDEAIVFFKKSLKLQKFDSVYSSLLFAMNMTPAFNQEAIYKESLRCGRGLSSNHKKGRGHLNSPVPERRLRIGYVSGDFKWHPVSFHLKPVLAAHNKQQVEVFLYNNFPVADKQTEELAGYADLYRDISSLADDAAEALIRQDGIDILVDLAGHTAFNRLRLFVLKPAPVQVSWLGYFNTTGLKSMDYLLSDPITNPECDDAYFTEQIFRLPGCRFCYQPLTYAPAVAATPALKNGYLTFGSFNGIQKITPEVIALWSRLLLEIPNSRLVLKSQWFENADVTKDFIRKFAAHGITAERIELRTKSIHKDMLAEYGDIDIALDTFPYNGGATTCEALWMGVPVVTLEHGTPISRQSKSFLYVIGHPEWVASTTDEYVKIIHYLTSDTDALHMMRANLRQKMTDSPLCNGPEFTQNLEIAYRQMWQRWCINAAPLKSYRSCSVDELYAAGYNCLEDGDLKRAHTMFNQVIRRNPRHVPALNGLGSSFEKMGDHSSAVKIFRKAISCDPSCFDTFYNFGCLYLNFGDFKKAQKNFIRASELDPHHITTLQNIAGTHRLLGRLQTAQEFCEKALLISPENVEILRLLAFVKADQGDVTKALELFDKTIMLDPDNVKVLTGLMSLLFYHFQTEQKEIFELSKQIARNLWTTTEVTMPLGKRDHFRIGFVSPDFCHHPVGLLLMALFKEFNFERLSFYCYSNCLKPDALTEWYKNSATVWRNILRMSDAEAAALIVDDEIDILVDLSGYTRDNRLKIFTLRPAPVQVSWIGFGHTTGLNSIDYIIADDDFIRPQDEQWFSEQVVRLPFNRFCFVPPKPAPEIVDPPVYDNGYITFGSFNNPMKISEQVIATWAQLLLCVPCSRLILKYKSFEDAAVRKRYLNLFAKHGISRSRIEFRKSSNSFFMMMEYGDIDIALDPFPFTGGMTSLYALWMGVPIVTLAGELPISRQTASFLKLVGLSDLVAFNEDEYISFAVTLAQNHNRLCDIRSSLRDTMARSPLCDAKAHAAALEHLFFEMWNRKVAENQDVIDQNG